MSKLRVIDLLNKIANGEEVPITIKYQDNYYNLIKKYNEDWEEYEFGHKNLNGGYLNIWRDNVLNDEVEIIGEKKIFEKLDWCEKNTFMGQKETTYLSPEERRLLDSNFKELGNKINSIIDYLKSKGE